MSLRFFDSHGTPNTVARRDRTFRYCEASVGNDDYRRRRGRPGRNLDVIVEINCYILSNDVVIPLIEGVTKSHRADREDRMALQPLALGPPQQAV